MTPLDRLRVEERTMVSDGLIVWVPLGWTWCRISSGAAFMRDRYAQPWRYRPDREGD